MRDIHVYERQKLCHSLTKAGYLLLLLWEHLLQLEIYGLQHRPEQQRLNEERKSYPGTAESSLVC